MGHDQTVDQITGRVVSLMCEALARGILACHRCEDELDASTGRIARTGSGVFAVHKTLRCTPPDCGQTALEAAHSRWFRRMMSRAGDGSAC